MILKFKTVLAIQYISFLKSFWDRFQSKMYWNEKHFAYNVIIISIICYNYFLMYIVSSTYQDHFRNFLTVFKIIILKVINNVLILFEKINSNKLSFRIEKIKIMK
jgi:hypothetical protein